MWVSWILIFRTPMVTPWDLQWLGTSQMQSGVGSTWERFLSRAKMEIHWFPSAMWLCQGLRQDWGVVSTVRKENAQRLWANCGLARPNLCVAILHLVVLIESPFCVSWRAGILKVVLHVAVVRPTWTNRRANAPNCISQGWQIRYHWILGGALSSSDLMWYKYPSNLFISFQTDTKSIESLPETGWSLSSSPCQLLRYHTELRRSSKQLGSLQPRSSKKHILHPKKSPGWNIYLVTFRMFRSDSLIWMDPDLVVTYRFRIIWSEQRQHTLTRRCWYPSSGTLIYVLR